MGIHVDGEHTLGWRCELRLSFSFQSPPHAVVLSVRRQMGHVDAGKSTLTGHLLHDLGLVSAKEMHRSRREAEEQVSRRDRSLVPSS